MPSQDEIAQQRQDVEELSALAVAATTAVIVAAGEDEDEDPRSVVKAVAATLRPYLVAAAELAVDWYRSLARTKPQPRPVPAPGEPTPILGPTDRIALLDAADFVPRPAELPPLEQIESTVWWALSAPDPAQQPPEEPADEFPDDLTAAADTEPAVRQRDTATTEPEPTPAEAPPRARVRPPAEGEPRARVLAATGQQQARVIPATPEQQAAVLARLAGATQRYVTTAARDTITSNAEREEVRWIRDAQPDACAFCRMLATRGTVGSDKGYLSEQSAKFVVGRRGRARGKRRIGELYHDWCQCEPVPIRAGDSYTPPAHVNDWAEQYEKAVAAVGNSADTKAILKQMRAAEKELGGSTR